MDIYEVIFDIETQNFFDDIGEFDPAKLKVSIVSLYFRKLDENHHELEGQMLSFWEDELEHMWQYFRKANRIIGFNSLGFDVPALKPYAPADFAKLPHFDVYLKTKEQNDGKAASLNRIAKDTLGLEKVDDPANAIKYWRKHDTESLTLLKTYCEADVHLTRDIYDFGFNNKYLKFTDKWNNQRTVPVDFSYPENSDSTSQPSLF